MKQLKRIIYSWVDKKFLGGCSSYNSLSMRKSCRSKKQARQMFDKNNIPHAKGDIFYGPFKPFRFVKKYEFHFDIRMLQWSFQLQLLDNAKTSLH
ncbi:hypothetical protein [Desulfobacula sp.]